MLFAESEILTWIILPLLIFFVRIIDVSLGTIRIIFVSRGQKFIAPFFGFFEVLIWLIAIGQVMQNLTNVFCYIAYAGGFATGTFVGMIIEEKIAMGVLLIRVITKKDATVLIESLKKSGYNITSVDADGNSGKVHLIYSVIKRKKLAKVIDIIKKFDSRAFYSVEDLKHVSGEEFPAEPSLKQKIPRFLRGHRQGK
ncbi:MAG: DUF2179 domain-containing protein [Candidatus Diapherotrites archaeon]